MDVRPDRYLSIAPCKLDIVNDNNVWRCPNAEFLRGHSPYRKYRVNEPAADVVNRVIARYQAKIATAHHSCDIATSLQSSQFKPMYCW